ncbi:hypothetical protein HK101_005204, partial [Irineochytrium annulatum]
VDDEASDDESADRIGVDGDADRPRDREEGVCASRASRVVRRGRGRSAVDERSRAGGGVMRVGAVKDKKAVSSFGGVVVGQGGPGAGVPRLALDRDWSNPLSRWTGSGAPGLGSAEADLAFLRDRRRSWGGRSVSLAVVEDEEPELARAGWTDRGEVEVESEGEEVDVERVGDAFEEGGDLPARDRDGERERPLPRPSRFSILWGRVAISNEFAMFVSI